MPGGRAPVAIVGAGLAGLKCALELQDFGVHFQIYEASDGVGGRARTDTVDGFRLDRGFQVLLSAYPEARKTFDYDALALGSFVPGARVRINDSFAKFADPLRSPRSAPASSISLVGNLADKFRVARMWRDLTSTDPQDLVRRPETSAILSLEKRGFTSGMIEDFFRPFFGGVFIDPDLKTSSRLMEIFFRCFSTGDTSLPAGGMGALADQMAARLPGGTITFGRRVTAVESEAIEFEDGSRVETSAVVVATEESVASGLCGLPAPVGVRTTTCLYFDAPEQDINGGWLILSPAGKGPINEVAVPSAVAAGYAPQGRSLVAVSVLGQETDRADLHESVITQLGDWFGETNVSAWQHLKTYRIEHALPAFESGRQKPDGEPPLLDSGVFICGDHRETPSIQGALVSGRKAAGAVSNASAQTGQYRSGHFESTKNGSLSLPG
ncbi:MAG: FAD-dependent oxidoreductase [Solirubrobacterales bacterium]|nr:FAD-dependent oxidoreductase [Solirubrobacterales bacterium]